jgi:DNA polymerase-3 subunit delta
LLRRDADAKSTPLKNLPETSLVVLMADDASGDENRLATRKRNWEKWVTANGGAIIAPSASGAAATQELKAKAKEYGKTISGPAIDRLLEMCGGGFSRAAEELDKICLYIGDAPTINESDVRSIVIPSPEWNVFAMMDGITKNDVAGALKQLRMLITNGDKADAAIFGSILPQTLRMLRLLYQARVCQEAGVNPASAPDSFVASFPSKPNICREKPFVQRQFMSAAPKLSLRKIQACMKVLADTDARLKGAIPAFSRTETMEMMVLEMVDTLHPARKVGVR